MLTFLFFLFFFFFLFGKKCVLSQLHDQAASRCGGISRISTSECFRKLTFRASELMIHDRQYFAKDGSLSNTIWQLGRDTQSPSGSRYAHLSTEAGSTYCLLFLWMLLMTSFYFLPGLLKDWNGFEKIDFSQSPAYGANSYLQDPHTS